MVLGAPARCPLAALAFAHLPGKRQELSRPLQIPGAGLGDLPGEPSEDELASRLGHDATPLGGVTLDAQMATGQGAARHLGGAAPGLLGFAPAVPPGGLGQGRDVTKPAILRLFHHLGEGLAPLLLESIPHQEGDFVVNHAH